MWTCTQYKHSLSNAPQTLGFCKPACVSRRPYLKLLVGLFHTQLAFQLVSSQSCPAQTGARYSTMSAANRTYGKVIEQNASGKQSAVMIMLHGLGDTGQGWSFLPQMMDINHVKFIFPTAPMLPITLNDGHVMPGWYDLPKDMSDVVTKTFDREGIEETVRYVREIVQKEIDKGTPVERIVIGGFSQGGHIAYKAALNNQPRVAACVALSTYMDPIGVEGIKSENKDMPIFVGHGEDDVVVGINMCHQSVKAMQTEGVSNIEKHTYSNLGHSASPEEFAHLTAFLKKHVPP